jgi:hypothetical protein
MNQALLAALQTTINEKNIILLVPYGCPEDDIIAACAEITQAAQVSKENRLAAEEAAKTAAQSDQSVSADATTSDQAAA